MQITQHKTPDALVIRLSGRLDAGWCDPVQQAFDAAVRSGEHRIEVDMADVDYISSAGLGVLLGLYKRLHGINGAFGITAASPFVESVLKLAGLASLISGSSAAQTAGAKETCRTETSARAEYEIFSCPGEGMKVSVAGSPSVLRDGDPDRTAALMRFDGGSFAIGIGALGTDYADCAARFGEFLAIAGLAAFQPSDASGRPDFVLSEGELVPEGRLLLGLSGRGGFPMLARFSAKADFRSVGLSELAAAALAFSEAPAMAFAAITETAGLVGASLRRSPAPVRDGAPRFDFPGIRDWLSFPSEPVHRDSTSLVVGVAARPGSSLDPLLRPMGRDLLGHFHAATFPYRPLQKGRIALQPSVAALFETGSVGSVLHLLPDTREAIGSGESEFLRGAIWISPVQPESVPASAKLS
ncbi:MAG TPA: STAS domain-containing protein [Terrimicrobiaceae bacterium]|nr:STAS domain-containing protein [Terrimicrobiaceae bacterium]